jgi:hypothetical protein
VPLTIFGTIVTKYPEIVIKTLVELDTALTKAPSVISKLLGLNGIAVNLGTSTLKRLFVTFADPNSSDS